MLSRMGVNSWFLLNISFEAFVFLMERGERTVGHFLDILRKVALQDFS